MTLVIDAIVGMDEKNEITINLYPVPAGDKIILEFSEIPQENTTAEIYSLQGVALLKSTIADKRTMLDISTLADGIYFLALDSKKGRVVKKLIVSANMKN